MGARSAARGSDVNLLGACLLALAALLAGLALLVGVAMAIDPSLVRPALLTLVLLTALAGASAVVGRRLREEAAEARAWGDDGDDDAT
jgi:hypothetical protein